MTLIPLPQEAFGVTDVVHRRKRKASNRSPLSSAARGSGGPGSPRAGLMHANLGIREPGVRWPGKTHTNTT